MKRQPPAPTQPYELWQDADGYRLIGVGDAARDALLKPPARLLGTFLATDLTDAKRQRDQYLRPHDPRDDL